MVWDFIRDFFVQYIFGGMDSQSNVYACTIGGIEDLGTIWSDTDLHYSVGENLGQPLYISLGDWLSTTMTIICMVLISICFILLVRWVFKAVMSAFLLK